MSDDLTTATGGLLALNDFSVYSDSSTNAEMVTTGIEVSTDGSQLEVAEVVRTDVQSLYPRDDASYMQSQMDTTAMGAQLVENFRLNGSPSSTESVQLNSSIQSFEDPQPDAYFQRAEQQQVDSQPDKRHEARMPAQSFSYTPPDALPPQHEPQTIIAQSHVHPNSVMYSRPTLHSQQSLPPHKTARNEGIVYQDSHSAGSSYVSNSNPPVQRDQYSEPSMYEQISSNNVTTNAGQSSATEYLNVGPDQSVTAYSQPAYGPSQPESTTNYGLAPDYQTTDIDEESTVSGLTTAMETSSLNDRSVDVSAAINAGAGVVSAAANVLSGDIAQGAISAATNLLSGDAVQTATSTVGNALTGDPVAAVQAGVGLVMSGVRIGASIGKWNEARQRRKESQVQLANAQGAANPGIMSQVAISAQLDEALLVLSVLGQRLVVLEVVNLSELPQALAVCRTACAQVDSGDLLEHFDTLDGTLQYTVTAALFFCAACWPMHIYRGFGTGVLNNFLWGCPHPQYSSGQTAGFRAIDGWISFLKSMPREVQLLTIVPAGLNRLVPTYGKNEKMERARLMRAYKQFVKEIEVRGHPQPRDGSFRVVSWHIPFATWNSPFTFKSSGHYWEDFIRWQMDPGRLLHAWTIGGHLDLSYGEMMWLPSGVAESIARFLVGRPGTTFKLIPSSAFDYGFLKLSPETRRIILEEGFETVKAVRDPQAESRRPSMLQNMFVPAPPPVVRRQPALVQNPTTAPGANGQANALYMNPQATTSVSQSLPAGSSHVMSNLQTAHSVAYQNIAQPIPSRPNGSIPELMSTLAAAQQSAQNLHHPNSQPVTQYNQISAQMTTQGVQPQQQKLPSMPNISSTDPQVQDINTHSAGFSSNQQHTPSLPNPQFANGSILHAESDPLVGSGQIQHTPVAQQPAMQRPQSFTTQSSPTKASQPTDIEHQARSMPMGGSSMARPQPQNPANPNHSMVNENPHINPLMRRSTNPSTVSITEGHPITEFHPLHSNPQLHTPQSSVSRTSTVSSRHSSSSYSSAHPQSSMTSYTSSSTPIASPLSPIPAPVSAPPQYSVNSPNQYPFPTAAQQPAAQTSAPVKRRRVPPPPPPAIVRKVKAIHSFEPEEDGELKFTAGDVLEVLKDDTGDGWLEAKLDGKVGSIPLTYVENV